MPVIVPIVLFLLVLAAYGFGVRREAAWGRPAVAVAVLALLFAVLDMGFLHVLSGPSSRRELDRGMAPSTDLVSVLASGLEGWGEPGSSVLIVALGGPGGAEDAMHLDVALREKLGAAGDVATYMLPPGSGIDDVVAEVEERQPAAVVLLHLPVDIEDLGLYDLADPPIIAVVVFEGQSTEDFESLLTEGIIQGVVVRNREGAKLYTTDNLADLPSDGL